MQRYGDPLWAGIVATQHSVRLHVYLTAHPHFVRSCVHYGTVLMQSFGAKNYSNLGIILQRALLVTAAACVLVVSFWTQMTKLLVFLGMLTQSP